MMGPAPPELPLGFLGLGAVVVDVAEAAEVVSAVLAVVVVVVVVVVVLVVAISPLESSSGNGTGIPWIAGG